MELGIPYPILAGIFVAVLFLVEGVYLVVRDTLSGRRGANRRLRMLAGDADGQTVLATLRRSRVADDDGWQAAILGIAPVAMLDRVVQRSGSTVPTLRLMMRLAVLTAVLLAVGFEGLRLPALASAFGAFALGIVLPILWLRGRGRTRLRKLGDQLPDAIDMIVRSLRAGHPVATAIGMVAREMPDPIGTEFGIVFDEMTYGMDMREALESMGARVPVPDFYYLVVAVRVQYGTGGNLTEVLSSLCRVIRERLRMKHRVRALSAEGRMSAAILSALPFVLAGVIMAMRPSYYLKAMADPAFPPLIGAGLAGIVLGILAMQRIVNFKF